MGFITDSAATAYFALVKSTDKKGNPIISLEAIPIYIDLLGKDRVFDFLKYQAELNEPQMLIEKIKLNSLLKLNGAYVWLRGKTGDRVVLCNANELILDTKNTEYLKRISSFIEKQKKTRATLIPTEEFDGITKEGNIALYETFVKKLSAAPYINLPTVTQQVEFLVAKKDAFCSMSECEQIYLLIEIIHFMQCNSVLSNLTELGGGAHAGSLLHSKKILNTEQCLLITQSPTGYYRNVIDLVSFYKK